MSPRDGDVDRPVSLPCNKCVGCVLDRKKDWAIRLLHELRDHEEASFLTATYDDHHLPTDGSLNHHHVQLALKRLRRSHGKFRYFMCGEYGPTTQRPHYHFILYGKSFTEDRKYWKDSRNGEKLWRSESLEKAWGLGAVYIGDVTAASCAYVAGYVQKKAERVVDHQVEDEDGRKPEYTAMSRNPGIGSNHFDRFHDETYAGDFCLLDGARVKPPRYYDNKLKELDPEKHKQVMAERRARAMEPEQVKERHLDRMAIREGVARRRQKMFSPRDQH